MLSFKIGIISSIIFLLFSSHAAATGTIYDIKRLYTSDGLCSNKIIDICQDSKGRMWFGTTAGVSRYDGAVFTNYNSTGKDYLRLSHNRAQALLAIDNGDVWIGTPDSLNIYVHEYEKIIRPNKEDGLIFTDITALCHGKKEQNIWIGTFGNGLVTYDTTTKKFDCETYVISCPCRYITALFEDPNDFLWIGTRHDGLYKMDLRTGTCKKVMPDSEDYIRCIFQDRSGNMWIGTDNGLYYAKGDIIEKIQSPYINGHTILKVTEDHQGRIWAGGIDICLNFVAGEIIHNKNAIVTEIAEGPLRTQISYKSINSIFCDNYGSIWAGSYGGGVNFITQDKQSISHIFPVLKQNGLNGSDNKTMSVENTTDGNCLFLGMDGAGLIKYNLENGHTDKIIRPKDNIEGNIISILVDRAGNLWTGSYYNGLSVIDKNGNTTKFPIDETGITIRSLYEYNDGNIYIGGENEIVISDKSRKIHKTGLKYDVRDMEGDEHGYIWMATYGNGVLRYCPSSGDIVTFDKGNGLLSTVVYDITICNGIVWCATDYGINGITLGNENHIAKTINNVSAVSITHDDKNNIWAAGTGVTKIDSEGQTFKYTATSDIFENIGDFSEGAALFHKGIVYFGGFNGVISIDTNAEFTLGTAPTPLIFTNLKIYDQQVIPCENIGFHNPLSTNINTQKNIVLKPWQNVFSIDFVSPEYHTKPEYEYILHGADNNWNYLGRTNSITFRNLPPEKYTLEIRARHAGCDSYVYENIGITILPYWYETITAKILLVIAIILILLLIYGYYASRLRLSYSLEVDDAKLTFFTNISHELRTPLTLLIAPLEQLIANETNETKLNSLKIINRNANRLLTLVNQILNFRKSEKGQMKIKVRETNIDECMRNIFTSFSDFAHEKNIAYTISQTSQNESKIWVDPSIIDQICMNLLSNAFKFTDEGGNISIKYGVEDKELKICVTDNGKGISKESQKKIFQRFYQDQAHISYNAIGSGIGLHLVKNLTELHHGRITLSSEVDKGSEFIVYIPCRREEYNMDEINISTSAYIVNEQDNKNSSYSEDSDSKEKLPVIVICDDNNEILDYLCSSLNDIYNIIRCSDGEIAISHIKNNPDVELLVCDIMMPGMNGLDVCRALKSDFEVNHIPIILLTAKSSMDDMLEGLECGADAYISKPFKLSHIKVQIKQLLKSREALKQKYQKKISFEAGGFDSAENEEEKFIQKLNQYILNHLGDPDLNWENICKELNTSRSSLHRKLKALTGLSSGDYIKALRLGKAAEILISTDLTVSEICFTTGFNSPSYFTSSFKMQYNMSPTEYRNQNKQHHILQTESNAKVEA